jgi:hypothetical protein
MQTMKLPSIGITKKNPTVAPKPEPVKPQQLAEKLERVVPVETDEEHVDKTGEKRVMQRNWQADRFGRFFPAMLTPEQMKPTLEKNRVKMEKLELRLEGEQIIYHYKGRPRILLNRKDGLFYAPVAEVEAFGKEAVQHQAHIVMDNLKKAGLTGAVLGKAMYPGSARQVLGHLRSYK